MYMVMVIKLEHFTIYQMGSKAFRTIALGQPGEAYNIGNEKPEISMLDLAKLFFKIENKNENIHKIAYPSNYPVMNQIEDVKYIQSKRSFKFLC